MLTTLLTTCAENRASSHGGSVYAERMESLLISLSRFRNGQASSSWSLEASGGDIALLNSSPRAQHGSLDNATADEFAPFTPGVLLEIHDSNFTNSR